MWVQILAYINQKPWQYQETQPVQPEVTQDDSAYISYVISDSKNENNITDIGQVILAEFQLYWPIDMMWTVCVIYELDYL